MKLYNLNMNKIEMAQELLSKFDIDLFKNNCRLVNIPGNYTKLIKEIFKKGEINIKFNFINREDGEYIETDFHESIVKSGESNTMADAHAALKMVDLIDFKYDEKSMKRKGWFIPNIKYKTLENYLWNNQNWYIDKKSNQSFRNRMYTAAILFIWNNQDENSEPIKKLELFKGITSNMKSNYDGMFEAIYSGIFNVDISDSQKAKIKKSSFVEINSDDLRELKQSYETIFKIREEISIDWLIESKYIKQIKNIDKYRKIFRESLSAISKGNNMNSLISDFPHLEAAHLVSVKTLILRISLIH